jgi:spermidine synthase
MPAAQVGVPPERARGRDIRVAPLLALFAASGCAALIYEVVWLEQLALIIGASAVSLGVLLAAFMGGMCLGSLLLARFMPKQMQPLHAFALLELALALFGVGIFYLLPAVDALYAALGGAGFTGMLVRAAVAAFCLLPPTLLMGATLPAIARALPTTPRGAASLGLCYAANIAGAMLGSLLAGFYLLRVHDAGVATLAAATLNVVAACASFALARAGGFATGTTSVPQALEPRAGPRAPARIYLALALSGAAALSAEVVWTRHLSLLFGATVYAFAVILAVFLLGLALGSGAASAVVRRLDPRRTFAISQWLAGVGIAWAAYAIALLLPYWPLGATLQSPSWVTLAGDALRAAAAILPPAMAWGASLPLALAATANITQDRARVVGRLYAANAAGAIAGALLTSLGLVSTVGGTAVQQALIVLCAGSGIVVLAPLGAQRRRIELVTSALVVGGAMALAAGVPSLPPELVAYGRFLPTRGVGANVLYTGEGLTTSIAISQDDGALTYHGAGKAQASSHLQDMRLQRMLGHLATLSTSHGRSFLVIGLGAGVTAGAVAIDPKAERVVVAEIEPLVPRVVPQYFSAQNFAVVDNPKVDIVVDDGRHYLLTTEEKFDGITSDPLDPWVKGAAALYTQEFWQLVKSRLNDGGVITVFVQLYESTEEAVRSEIATFFEVFPNGVVFANTVEGMGYDAVLLGRAGDAPLDVDAMHTRLRSPEYGLVARSLADVGFSSAVDLLATYAAGARDLRPWLRDATINTDRNLRLQYLAGEGLNEHRADAIHRRITAGVAFPETLFAGSPALLTQLRQQLRSQRR